MRSVSYNRDIIFPSVLSILLLLSRSCVARTSVRAFHIRGGGNYEYNPNYVPPPPPSKQRPIRPVTLGDLDTPLGQQPSPWGDNQSYQNENVIQQGGSDKSTWQTISRYFKQLHQISPTLSLVSMASIAIFITWQIPACKGTLARHFLCSRNNLADHRPQSLLLCAVSHSSVMHLVMNLMAYTSFGPQLRQTLKASHWPLWPLVVGAALSGSLVFLILGRGSCLGLSSVTLAFLALQAKLFPDRQFGTVLGVFLVQLPAHLALKLLLVVSALGSLDRSSSVAHTAHLGGLLFGITYYEIWLRRKQLRKLSRQVQSALPRRRK